MKIIFILLTVCISALSMEDRESFAIKSFKTIESLDDYAEKTVQKKKDGIVFMTDVLKKSHAVIEPIHTNRPLRLPDINEQMENHPCRTVQEYIIQTKKELAILEEDLVQFNTLVEHRKLELLHEK